MRPERFSCRADGFSQPVERFAAASGNYSLRIHGSLSLDPFRVMEPGTENRWPLVAIVGPTASGKSALALKLAEELGGEILNCDSIQVYRHLDIGSGKVTAEWRQRVPHHLLDIALPDEDFAAGDYRRKAEEVLREVRGRRRLPFVVGGAGLYLRALLVGLFESPGPSKSLRRRLADLAESKGRRYLHRILARLDAPSAESIEPNDVQKVIRGLEVCLLARQRMSDLQARGRRPLAGFHVIELGLNPPRPLLVERIDRRVAEMFEAGLISEVEGLMKAGYSPRMKAFGALGYQHAWGVLCGELSREEAVAATQRDTRRYAKRQMTWFRHQVTPEWFEGVGDDPEVQRRVKEWLVGRLRNWPFPLRKGRVSSAASLRR